ncbi:MAG: recombination mediator RecR [Acidobacteriota bacterium]|jgi:recombination protein RecR|nr:recombination mediator RecR [Acidobacteriota bacterium]NLT32749.1 recombination protein RecR [Acidobacteriota bacterium]
MSDYAEPIEKLIDEFRKFPGIGPKSAERLTYSVLRRSREDAERLSRAILEVKDRIRSCSRCNNFSDLDPCAYCRSGSRSGETICVVEEPGDIIAVERTREYRGRYHVLHGALSPINGVGPEDLRIRNLLERLREGEVKEIILATNPNVEGEATALYLARLLKPIGVRVSRLALGLPVGSDLEYADEVTMSKALEHRHEL